MNTQQNNKPILILKKHVDIINQNVEELIMFESEMEKIQKRIRDIKNSKWQKARNYFILKKHRKCVKTTPNRENGYTIEFFKNTNKNNRPNLILKEYIDIINQNIEELIMLELEMEKIQEKIREIKDAEWQKACRYFRLAKQKNWIKSTPNKKNGYTIEFFDNTQIVERTKNPKVERTENTKKDLLTKKMVTEIIKLLNEEDCIKKDTNASINPDDLKIISSRIYNSVLEYIMNK